MRLPRTLQTVVFSAVLSLSLSPPAAPQSAPQSTEADGINSGNYNIHQSVEFGYRNSDISGNLANYDTFVNLNSGVRLFEQSVEIRSLNHSGFLFDNLSMNSFGYGGDPNNVTRLRIGKNKWYDFRGSFRRDKYPWNYNLLANPLNPASSTPAVPITNSLHALYLVRRMSDFDLTLLPQSRIKFRLGYTRNIQEGPSFTTFGGATLLDPPTRIWNANTIIPRLENNSERLSLWRGLPGFTQDKHPLRSVSAVLQAGYVLRGSELQISIAQRSAGGPGCHVRYRQRCESRAVPFAGR